MAKGYDVLSTGEVARICNVTSRTVAKWFDNGLLGGYRIPGSTDRRIPIEELARFMEKHNIPIPTAPEKHKGLKEDLQHFLAEQKESKK